MSDNKEVDTVKQELDTVNDEMKQHLVNRQDDYDYGRDLLYSSAERLQDILDSAVTLAQESEHPRSIEVAKDTALALAEISGKMMEHHLKVEKLKNSQNAIEQQKNVTNNNLNVKLSTKDLLDLLNKD